MKSRFIILLMAALIVAAPAETSARKKKAKEEDSRIGTFFWGVEHFSDEDEVKALYYANHWDIYPSDVEAYRRGELVEPVKPRLERRFRENRLQKCRPGQGLP